MSSSNRERKTVLQEMLADATGKREANEKVRESLRGQLQEANQRDSRLEWEVSVLSRLIEELGKEDEQVVERQPINESEVTFFDRTPKPSSEAKPVSVMQQVLDVLPTMEDEFTIRQIMDAVRAKYPETKEQTINNEVSRLKLAQKLVRVNYGIYRKVDPNSTAADLFLNGSTTSPNLATAILKDQE